MINPREIAKIELELLTGYTMSCLLGGMGSSIQLYESNLDSYTTVHFAYPVDESPLTNAQIEQLGEAAQKLQVDFEAKILSMGISIHEAGVYTRINLNDGNIQTGITKLSNELKRKLIDQQQDGNSILMNAESKELLARRDHLQKLYDKDLINDDWVKSYGADLES